MKAKLIIGLTALLAMTLAMGAALVGCDDYTGGVSDGGPRYYEPLIIKGLAANGDNVEVTITTTRTVPRVVLTPMDGDTYVLRLNGYAASRGIIGVSAGALTFHPDNNGQSFTVSYTKGQDIYLTEIPTPDGGVTDGTIHDPGHNPGGSGSDGNSTPRKSDFEVFCDNLYAITAEGKDNVTKDATANTVTLTDVVKLNYTGSFQTLTIPSGVKLLVADDTTLEAGTTKIAGAGTLVVEAGGTLMATPRHIMVKTIVNAGATFEQYNDPSTSPNNTVLVGDNSNPAAIIQLETEDITVTYNSSNKAFNFTLNGVATIIGPIFPLGLDDDSKYDTVTVASDATLKIGAGAVVIGGGTINVDGTVDATGFNGLVASSVKMVFKTGSALKMPPNSYPFIGGPSGALQIQSGGSITLDIADIAPTNPPKFTLAGPIITRQYTEDGDSTGGVYFANALFELARGTLTVDKNHLYVTGTILNITGGGQVNLVSGSFYVDSSGNGSGPIDALTYSALFNNGGVVQVDEVPLVSTDLTKIVGGNYYGTDIGPAGNKTGWIYVGP